MHRRWLLLVGLWGCAEAKTPALTALDYEVSLQSVKPAILNVKVEAKGKANWGFHLDPRGLVSIEIQHGNGQKSSTWRGETIEANCEPSCTISYQYDLSRAAQGKERRIRGAKEREGEILVDGPTFLLHPKPTLRGISVPLRIHAAEGLFITSGLRKGAEKDLYSLRSEELGTLGFLAFGKKPAQTIRVHGGEISTYIFPGKRSVSDEAITRWVHQSASTFDHLFGRFPKDHAAVFVIPYPGSSSVDFGVAMGAGGATIAVLMGEDADEKALLADDWVLVHEMFHLGVPTFRYNETWLNEGLATYYEALLRTRAGILEPDTYWERLAKDMPQGVQTDEPLWQANSYQRMYWGGAFLAMRADIEIRRQTKGKYALDDGLSALLADGGDITEIYSIAKIAEIVQSAVGVNVLGDLIEQANRGPVEKPCLDESAKQSWPPRLCTTEADALKSLLHALGIRSEGKTTTFRDDAPLAKIRNELVAPKATRRLANALEIETFPLASTNNRRRFGIEEIGIMNQPHAIADFLR